jgi:hypothetical protein
MASNNNNVFAGGTAVAKPAKQKKGNANVTRNTGNNNISGALKSLGISGKNVPVLSKYPKREAKKQKILQKFSNIFERGIVSNKLIEGPYESMSNMSNNNLRKSNSNSSVRGTNSNNNIRVTNSNSSIMNTNSSNKKRSMIAFSSRGTTPGVSPNRPKRNNRPFNVRANSAIKKVKKLEERQQKLLKRLQNKPPNNKPTKKTKTNNKPKTSSLKASAFTKNSIFNELKKYRMEKDKLTNEDFNRIINKIYNEYNTLRQQRKTLNANTRYSRYRFYRDLLYRLQKIYPQMPSEYRNKVKNYIFSSNIKYEGNGSKFVKNVDKYVKNIVINEMKNIIMGNYRYGKRNFNNQISKLAMRYSENGNSNTNENKNLRLIITNALQNIFMSSVNENKRPKAIKELLEYLEPSELYTLLESVSKKDFSLLMTYLKDKFKIQKNITNQNAFKFILSKVLNIPMDQLNKNIAGRKLETSGFTKLHPTTYKKYKESNKIRKSIKEIKEKQKNMSSNERRLSNIKLSTLRKKLNNLSGYSNITKRRDVLNIKLKDKEDDIIFTTFIQKIYMDMIHDQTLPGKTLDEKYNYFVNNIIPTIFDTNIENIMSKTYTKPYNPPRDKRGKVVKQITLPYNKNNVEKLAKEEIQSYLNLKTNTLGHTSRIKLRKKVMDPMDFTNINSPMKVVIDSDNDNILEDLIKKSKNLKSTKVLASIYDPGDSLTSFALYPRCKKAMNKQRSSICITNNNMEIDFSPLYFSFDYQKDGNHRASTFIRLETDVKEKIKLTVEDKTISNMPTASAAAKSETPLDKVSKFLGDFMQILYVIRNNKAGVQTCFATIDKSAANMYVYLSKILKVKSPLMFLEYTGNQFSQDSGYYVWFYQMKKYVNAQSNNIMFKSPPSTIQSLPPNSPGSARPTARRVRTSLNPENFLTPNVETRVQKRKTGFGNISRTLFGNRPSTSKKKSRFSQENNK